MKTNIKKHLKQLFRWGSLILLISVISCTQETADDSMDSFETVSAKSKKSKKSTRAWRGKFTNVADPSIPLVSCIPDVGFNLTTNIISGNMTHMGKIQPGSFGRPQEGTCFLTGENTAVVIYHVNYIGAHGDMITTIETVALTVDFEADPNGQVGTFDNARDADGNIIPITILEGTGRFAGATGELYFVNARFSPGANGTVISSWGLQGEITY